ncbi:MAG TPA: SHOCT domain-containing protein [Alphaproteobacteria bacterium]|nr:SHOCT domain-containing protein [Alphaproteobacteria bacterium]
MNKITTAAVGAGVALAGFMPVLAEAQTPGGGRFGNGYGYGHNMMWDGGWGFGMILGPIFMVLVLVAVFAAVILLVRWIGGPGHHSTIHHHMTPPTRTPLDILKERFAKGEIDKDEFEDRKRALGD